MDYWHILGIEPTQDIMAVKQAYAKAVKLHHPEDDPEGFAQVMKAYKEATNEIKRREALKESIQKKLKEKIDESAVITKEIIINEEENDIEQQKFKFHIIVNEEKENVIRKENVDNNENEINNENEDIIDKENIVEKENEKENEDVEDNYYDFENLEIFQANIDTLKKEKLHRITDIFTKGYNHNRKRNSLRYWRDFFANSDFKVLQRDASCTVHFMKLLSRNCEFSIKIWEDIVEPVLKEWGDIYEGCDSEALIEKTMLKMRNIIYSPKRLQAMKKEKMCWFLGTLLKVCFICCFIWLSGDNKKEEPVIDKTELNYANEYWEEMAFIIISDISEASEYDNSKEAYVFYKINKDEYQRLNKLFISHGEVYLNFYLKKRSLEIVMKLQR